MKLIKRFLLLVMCAMPLFAQAQVATTAGSNLTAWNGNSGATNNNNWNQMMNNRTMATGGGAAPTADFGNCNSLILRCAQPKCAGCTTVDIARPIVAGCVNSNATCKKYGDDLIEFISAQMVSNANSKAQQQQIAAQQAAAQAAAAQNSAQMAQMQQQMQQMQYEMQQQNAQQMAQMQAALDEQKQIAAAAQAAAVQQATMSSAATVDNVADGLTQQQLDAARGGVPEEIMLRQQVSGQILTKIDNADVLLKNLKATMEEAFAYAGCDTRGNNCSAPKRVKVFKDKAQKFFEPYDDIVDETYDALETALAVGVDVSDVIMMLSGSCNKWGKFLCTGVGEKHVVATYTKDSCPAGKSIKGAATKVGADDERASAVKTGNLECTIGMAVPPQDDVRCTLVGIIDEDVNGGEGVYREWLDENYEGDRLVRVGCATSALESISVFGRRTSRSGATLDLDVLERILAQDAPDYGTVNRYMRAGSGDERVDRTKYCALTEKGYQTLLRAVQTKKLPDKICVTDKQLVQYANTGGALVADLSAWGGTGGDSGLYVPGANEDICNYYGDRATNANNGCGTQWNTDTSRCVVTGNPNCRFVQPCDDADGTCIKQVSLAGAATTNGNSWSNEYDRINELETRLFYAEQNNMKTYDKHEQNCRETGGEWLVDGVGYICECKVGYEVDKDGKCKKV